MRIPLLVRLLSGLAIASLVGCSSGPSDGALQVVIDVDSNVPGSCVVLEVSTGGAIRLTQELARPSGKNPFRVGLKQTTLPVAVTFTARTFRDDCSKSPRVLTSASAPVNANFPRIGVETATLNVHLPGVGLDGDGDTHVDQTKGGDDCNDAVAAIHPGQAESCTSTADNDCDGKAGCADTECSALAMCTVMPTELAYVTTPTPTAATDCSTLLTVELRDVNGPVSAPSAIAIALTASATKITFFSDPACTTAATSLTLPPGQQRASFSFKATTVGTFNAVATAPALTAATQLQTVTPAQVRQLAFLTSPQMVTAGACSGELRLETRDSNSDPTGVLVASSIALSTTQSGVTFYSDVGCLTPLAGSAIQLAAGATTGSFYARATAAQATVLTATLSGVPATTQVLTVTAAAPSALAFATGAQGIASGACSSVVTVEVRDGFGNAAPVSAATVVALATTGVPISLFSVAGCGAPLTAGLAIAAGSSSGNFYFQGTGVGMATVTATATGLSTAIQVESVGVGPPSKLAFTNSARTAVAGQCSAVLTVQVQDANNNPSNVAGAPLLVTIAGPVTAAFGLFTDSACATAFGGTVTIPIGGTTTNLYFRGTAAGTQIVTATTTGLTMAMQNETISAAPATMLAFTSAPQTQPANFCTQFNLEARDAFGNPSAPVTAAVINLTTPQAFVFSPTSACATPVTSVTLTTATTSFFGRSTVAGTKTLTATAPFGAAVQTFVVAPLAASKLVVTTPPRTIGVGACSPVVTLEAQDSFNNPSAPAANLVIALTHDGSAGFAIHAGAGCGGAATSVTLNAGQTSVNLSFTGTKAEAVTMTFTPAGLPVVTQVATLIIGAATKLVFTTAPSTITTGGCAPVTVQRQDALDNPVTGAFTVNLSSTATGGLTFHSAAGCMAPSIVTGAQIPAGASSVTFYVRATKVEPVTITAAGTGLTSATQALTVNAGPATKLVFTSPAQMVTAGGCTAVVTVERADFFNNPVSTGALTVNLSSSATTGLTFNTVAGCTGGTTTVQIAAGSASASFYVGATRAEAVTLTAAAGGLANGTQVLTVNAGPATKLVFLTAPQTLTAGGCMSTATIQRQDAFDNPVIGALTVNLSSSATTGLTFYGAAACGGSAVTSVAIGAANSSVSFGVRATKVEPVTLTASAGALADATQGLTINPGVAAKLVFTTAAQVLAAGSCTGVVTVERQDVNSNPTTTGALTVNLTSTATTGLTFNTGATCTGGTTSVAIAAGASSAPFYVRATKVEPVTLTGAGGGLANAVQALTVVPGAATQLVFTTAAQTGFPNGCSNIVTVQVQDAQNNPAPVAAASQVNLTSNGVGFTFHLVSLCGDGPQTQTSIGAGASSASFYFDSTNTGSVTMSAAVAGLPVATQLANITASAVKLAFTTSAQTITAGGCSGKLTVQRQDGGGGAVTGGGPLTVALTSSAASGLTFFSDAACSAVVSTAQIAGGNSSADFYVSATVAESVTLTGAAGVLTNATQTFTTNAGPANKLVFTSPASQTLPALGCSAVTTVTQTDSAGNPVNALAAVTVTFSAAPAGPNVTFYTNAACTTAMAGNTRAMAIGTSTVTLFFRSEFSGAATLTATAPLLTAGTQAQTFTAATPTKLVFTTVPPATVEAGFCQPLTLVRQDALSRSTSPAFATTVTLGTVPATGMLFFTDAACTTALGASFDILSGSPSTVVYAKGLTGSLSGNVPGNQGYAITATSAPLTPNPTVTVTVQPMVRRRASACTLGGNTVTCAITPTLADITRTILFFQATPSGSDDNPSDDNATCRLIPNAGVAQVICDRVGSGSNVNVEWQTVSFPYSFVNGGVSVQHLTAGCTAGQTNTMPIDLTIAPVTTNRTFVLTSSKTSGADNDSRGFFLSQLTAASTVRLSQADGSTTCNSTVGFDVQVVSWTGAAVSRNVNAGGAGASFTSSQTTTLSTQAFLLYTSTAAASDTGTSICRRRMRGEITDGSTLTFSRGCTGADVADISWEHVVLPAGGTVQAVPGAIASSATTDANTITAVDLTRSFAFIGGHGPGGTASGSTDHSTEDRVGSALARAVLTSATQLTFTRTSNSGNGLWMGYVVQLTP